MLCLLDVSPVPQQVDEPEADHNVSPEDNKMSAEAFRTLFADFADFAVCPPAFSHYTDPLLDLNRTNSPLVLYVKHAAKSQMVRDSDELDTHGVPFQTISLFTVFSGDQDREVRSSVYHDLMNLMLSQMTEDNQLINVSASRTKADGPFHSNIEKRLHLRSRTIYNYSGPFKETQRVFKRTLGLYQLGQQHKAGSSSYQWPPLTGKKPLGNSVLSLELSNHAQYAWGLSTDVKTSNIYGGRPSSRLWDSQMLLLVGGVCHPFCTLCIFRWITSCRKSLGFCTPSASQDALKRDLTRLDDLLQWPTPMSGRPTDVTWCSVTATELYSSTYALETYSLRIALSWPSPASLRSTQGHVAGRSWPFWSVCP